MADEIEKLSVTLEANAADLIEDTNKAVKRIEKQLEDMGRRGEDAFDRVGKGANSLTAVMGKLKAAAGAFIAIFAVGKVLGFFQAIGGAVVQANSQFETFATQFETLLGSASAAQQRLDELAQFAVSTPFELPQVVEASRVLEVFGGSAISTGDTLRMVGDIAAGVNQPFQDVAFWVGRMYDSLKSGRPFGEAALRLQEMGALSGDVRAKLEAMQKAGADGAEIFAFFSEQVGGRFAGNMERLAQTFQGVISNLSDFKDQLLRIGGEPFFEEIRDSASDFLDIISEEKMSAALLAVAKAAGEAGANLTKIVSSGVLTSLEDLDPATVQKFADALEDLGAALSEAAGKDIQADLNLFVDALTIAIDTGTVAVNTYNRFSGVVHLAQGALEALKDVLLTMVFPLKTVIDGFSALNDLVEQISGERVVDFSRDIAEASETTAQAAAKYNQAAEEIANLSALGPGKQAETPAVVEEAEPVDEKALEMLNQFSEDLIDATEERSQAIEELEKEHSEKVLEIERDAIADRIDVWEDLHKDLLDLERDATEDRIEAAKKYERAIEKLESDTADRRKDIIGKTKEDLSKLENETDDKLKDERREFNVEEKRETQDHLEEMRGIRRQYLFDLENAVASRDARAIVDLRRRFEMEKGETQRSFETDQQRRREDRDMKLQEIRQEESDRAAEIIRNREEELRQLSENEAKKRAEIEFSYQEQITKINEGEARKREELMARALEEIADINASENEKLAAEAERFTERQTALEEMLIKRLETIGKALADEEKINADSAKKVVKTLNKAFGIGGDVDKIMEDFIKRRAKKMTVQLDFEGVEATGNGLPTQQASKGFSVKGGAFQHGTGGWRIFNKPTAALFAETSPEAVNIRPLSQMNKMDGAGPREMDLNVKLSGNAPPGINTGEDRNALASVLVTAFREAGFRARG